MTIDEKHNLAFSIHEAMDNEWNVGFKLYSEIERIAKEYADLMVREALDKVSERIHKVGPVYRVDQYTPVLPPEAEIIVPIAAIKEAVKQLKEELTKGEK